LVGSRDTAFPYWVVEDGLPQYPPHGAPEFPGALIVCVCSCGKYACGHTGCRITRDGDQVDLNEFDFDVTPEGARKAFRFSAANYDAVCKTIPELAREQRELDVAGRC
jgi:hypothetical protein